ncbi:trypsin-like peptidase domain-containing protein [Streptomyces boluensis]|uniref:PDZ domain-containing protein n=1 Tax=Streptomyces boluensis TaxID=1775135 RepID=A0A964XKJ7_9ACTN|nr:trypsin-like peptidase domain-containing protein [Streptomyces boluensis]NBE52464.1 PDZ domain-containing protein [Streptomyces boluensis]
MDEGKPTGPKAKWWSRPAARGAERGQTPDETSGTPQTAVSRVEPERIPERISEEQSQDRIPEEQSQDRIPEERPQDRTAEDGDVNSPPSQGSSTGVVLAKGRPEPIADAEGSGGRSGDRSGGRPKPLHDPDPYSTPPYGEPGPWAPAPPVQRPVPTPAQGTPVPGPAATPAQPTSAYATPPTPAAPTGNTPANGTPPHGTQHHGTQQHAAQHHGTQPQSAPPHGTAHQAAPQQPAPQQPASQQQQPAPQHQQPQPQQQAPAGQWQQYDPWRAPQPLAQPLLLPDGPAPARRPKRGRIFLAAMVLALVAGGVGGGVGAYMERHGGISTVELPQADGESKERAPESVAGIAASALPSVVTLHVSGGSAQGTGTGFVLDDKGHILTNNHVVEPAGDDGEVSVTFSGGEAAKATVVGRDSGYDLAVVKVAGVSGLKPLPLGNSDNVQVGDPVVAIGAPFDLSNTVTSGIISAKERPITAGGEEGDGSDVSYVDALQTDAPINPGNSGGPLVDHKARVIGINSAIRSAGNGSELDGGQSGSIGLGFAIPINQAKRVAEELINTGKATHPVIEVTLDTRYNGDGARVAKEGADGAPAVSKGGPGDKAGIEPGDVITEVDGQRVHSGEELIVKIRAHRPGDRLELTLERGGEEKTLSLELGAAGS